MPELILTARDALSDRVAVLNSGADDYLVKPFALKSRWPVLTPWPAYVSLNDGLSADELVSSDD